MEQYNVPQAAQENAKDGRAQWITPAITDYDIEEATLSGPIGEHDDSYSGYS